MAHEHRKTDPDIAIALPIVPMLDLSFQILFFFIITFNPSKAEGKMSLNLPASGQAKAKDPSSVDLQALSDPTDLEIPSEFVVVVRSYEDSFSLSIRGAATTDELGTVRGLAAMNEKERRAEIDKLLNKLYTELKNRLDERKKQDPKAADNIKIEANGRTKYAMLVAVMDQAIRAGYAQVGFAPPSDLGQLP